MISKPVTSKITGNKYIVDIFEIEEEREFSKVKKYRFNLYAQDEKGQKQRRWIFYQCLFSVDYLKDSSLDFIERIKALVHFYESEEMKKQEQFNKKTALEKWDGII